MEQVSTEMQYFFHACDLLLEEMSPRDVSEKECRLIEHYCLELFVKYGRRTRQAVKPHRRRDSQSSSE